MKDSINKVKEFHEAFNIYVGNNPYPAIAQLRAKLIEEETEEVSDELNNWDLDGDKSFLAKELADLAYVLFGTVISFGLEDKFEEVFNSVHESNMSKLENGKPVVNGENGVLDNSRPLGKVLKGKNYKEADIKSILC